MRCHQPSQAQPAGGNDSADLRQECDAMQLDNLGDEDWGGQPQDDPQDLFNNFLVEGGGESYLKGLSKEPRWQQRDVEMLFNMHASSNDDGLLDEVVVLAYDYCVGQGVFEGGSDFGELPLPSSEWPANFIEYVVATKRERAVVRTFMGRVLAAYERGQEPSDDDCSVMLGKQPFAPEGVLLASFRKDPKVYTQEEVAAQEEALHDGDGSDDEQPLRGVKDMFPSR